MRKEDLKLVVNLIVLIDMNREKQALCVDDNVAAYEENVSYQINSQTRVKAVGKKTQELKIVKKMIIIMGYPIFDLIIWLVESWTSSRSC